MAEHTKLPVSYQEVSAAYTHIVRGPNNEFLCSGPQDSSGETEAFMRLIVTAVNYHEKLTTLLGMARHQLHIRPSKFAGQWALDVDALLAEIDADQKEAVQ